MIYKNAFLGGAAMIIVGGFLSSCNDSKSYAELLTDEMHSVNNFLANQDVILELPDEVFLSRVPMRLIIVLTRTGMSICR